MGCARVQAPPGGPTDKAPPLLTSTLPDSLAVLPRFDGDVEFRFNEVVSEGASPNFGTGTGGAHAFVSEFSADADSLYAKAGGKVVRLGP